MMHESDEIEQPFEDGNITAVVRVGDTVRRATGPWTPAIHALLRHLETRGFDAAPRALGRDQDGREMLSYLPGQTAPASLQGIESDAVLAAVARLTRRYHDAVADFVAPSNAAWQFTVGAPRTGDVICHNDIAPWNVVFDGAHPRGLIDWDFAAPAPRAWDIAYPLWVTTDHRRPTTPLKQAKETRRHSKYEFCPPLWLWVVHRRSSVIGRRSSAARPASQTICHRRGS
jgi:Ser/Thr protein kinase RdoA (MazF antagonist)